MKDKTIAIVQVSGTRFDKGEEVCFEFMEDMVPCHSCWEELLDPMTEEEKDTKVFGGYDSVVRESVLGLQFYSVGDWPEGSFFDHEKEMIGIEEVVDPFKASLVAEIEKEFSSWLPSLNNIHRDAPTTVSILTLWTGQAWQNWEGEYDSEFDYDGVIDMSKLPEILKGEDKDVEA